MKTANDAAWRAGPQAVAAAVTLGTLSIAVLLLLPGLMSALADQYHFNDRELGLFSMADLGGLTLGSLFGAQVLGRVGIRRGAQWGLFLGAAANALSVVVLPSHAVLALRFIAGLGAGLPVAACYWVVGRSRHVDRNFSIYVVCQGLFGAVALKLVPPLVQVIGVAGIFGALAILYVAAAILPSWFPSSGDLAHSTGAPRVSGVAWAGLTAVLVFFVAQGAVWGYLELIGRRGGVAASSVESGVSLSVIIGMSGPLTAAVLGERFGRLGPLIAGTVMTLTALVLLGSSLDAFRFSIAACLYNIAWNFTIPYQLAVLADADPSGKALVWAAPASLAGLAVGPSVAAVALGTGGLEAVLWLCAALIVGSLIGLTPGVVTRRVATRA
jgi:hypothetical protein